MFTEEQVKLWRDVQRHVLDFPETYRQDTFGDEDREIGITGCIMTWACLKSGKYTYRKSLDPQRYGGVEYIRVSDGAVMPFNMDSWANLCSELLGVGGIEARRLVVGNWPEPFKGSWAKARLPGGPKLGDTAYAQILSDYIDWLLKQDSANLAAYKREATKTC